MKYFFGIIILLFTITQLQGQSSVTVNDYSNDRGKDFSVLVKGTIATQTTSMIEIKFRFNAMVIAVKKVVGGNNYSIKDENPIMDVKFNNYTNAELTIQSDNFTAIENGNICSIILEGLAGPDSVTDFEPISLKIDGIEQSDASFMTGKISINSTPVQQEFFDALSANYPNPFSSNTKFTFTIEKDTKVKFSVFSNGSREAFSFPSDSKTFSVKFFNSDGSIIDSPEKHIFNRGRYTLEIVPVPWEVTSGVYYFVFKTELNVFKENLIYIK